MDTKVIYPLLKNVIIIIDIYVNGAIGLKLVQRGHYMMTSSNGNIFRVTGPLCGEFTGRIFFDLRLNKRLSK